MKKHRYVRLENLDKYDGWDLVEVIPKLDSNHYAMGVVRFDDTPQTEDIINLQKAEIERLQSMNQAKLDMIHDLQTELETAKAEAVKEFIETLKYKFPNGYGAFNAFDVIEIIEDTYKEMVGDV